MEFIFIIEIAIYFGEHCLVLYLGTRKGLSCCLKTPLIDDAKSAGNGFGKLR